MHASNSLVLVTGGAGYIGSAVTGLLLREGYRVRVLDRFFYGGESLLAYQAHPCCEIIQGDIRRREDVAAALAGVGAVIHLAAIVGDPACAAQPELAISINRDGARLVCDQAIRAGVERFVFASTCSNYGKMADPEGYVDEASPLRPVSLYAELKVEFEMYLMALNHPGVVATCLRFATAYGLSPRPRFDLTVNEFTRELTMGRTLEIFGEQFWRPYCHVTDLARGCLLTLKAPKQAVQNRAINIGDTAENYQKKTLVELIAKAVGDRVGKIVFIRREEDPRDYRVRFETAGETLGFTVSRRVVDGIAEIVAAIESGLIKDPDHSSYRNGQIG